MRILLCAATEAEISPTIQALSLNDRHAVRFLITGVGLLSATYALTKEVMTDPPEAIIQAGVAGAFDHNRALANVVAVQSECLGDLGVKEEGGFQSLFGMNLLNPDAVPWRGGKLVNESDLLSIAGLPLVQGVTVNEITTATEKINYYKHTLRAEVESMEGAALHYIALQEKIPFLQVRSLSNFIGERDKSNWQLKEAITKLNRQVQNILTELKAL